MKAFKIVSGCLGALSFLAGACALFLVGTDVGKLCAIIVMLCAWMVIQFAVIEESIRLKKN